jgi:PAS domain S-box-containing protein
MPDFREGQPIPIDKESAVFRSSLELLYEIGREVTGDLDLRTLLHRVLFLSMKNVGAISGSIIVIDENSQPTESALLILGETHSHTAQQLRVTYEHGMAGWVARNRQAALVPDTRLDDRWLQRPEDLRDNAPPKSAVSAPILARGDNLVGVITLVHPQAGFFTPDHLALVEAIADWAGTAILHAQLFERLQAANRRYRELFEDSIDPILITDGQGAVLEINRQAEKTIGLPSPVPTDVNIADLIDIPTSKIGRRFENLTIGETVSYEAPLRASQGNSIPVQVYARAFETEKEAVNIQWMLRDLSERKDLDRLREDLTAMIYHDLRSPLSNVISSLEMLSAMLGKPEDESIQSMLDIARRSTDRIQRLTSSLLDIHRLESGQPLGSPQPVNLIDLLEEALTIVQPAFANKSQLVAVQTPANRPWVLADADMIRRVIINLLDNASKFTPDNGEIRVEVARQNNSVLVRVSDTGPGIASLYHESIFEKFSRVSSKDGPKGLGLGLAYCRLAIGAHAGRIWVESRPGQGAKFSFTLPVCPAPLENAAAPDENQPVSSPSGGE